MNPLKLFSDSASRRADRAIALQAEIADLSDKYRDAIEAGDDDAADKILKKRRDAQDKLDGVRTAMEVDAQVAAERVQLAAEEQRRRQAQEHADSVAAYKSECAAFDDAVQALALHWATLEQMFAVARERGLASGVDLSDSVAWRPQAVWQRVFARLVQATGQKLPAAMSLSRRTESVAELIGKESGAKSGESVH